MPFLLHELLLILWKKFPERVEGTGEVPPALVFYRGWREASVHGWMGGLW